MKRRKLTYLALITALALAAGASGGPARSQAAPGAGPAAAPAGTGFTYQGQLRSASGPVNAACGFQFSLWDALSAGNPVGATQPLNAVAVSNGLFSVVLNGAGEFGPNAFTGEARWLEVEVKCPTDAALVTLSPRQALTGSPYALHSLSTGALQGRGVSGAAPTPGQVLKWDGTQWAPASDNGATYTAGAGIAIGSGNQIGLASSFQLPQACGNAQIAKWNGATWACAADNDTTYSPGSGLDLAGTQFSVNTGTIQARVSGSCPGGQAVRAVDAAGAVTCEPAGLPGGLLVLGGSPTAPAGYSFTGLTVLGSSGDFWTARAAMTTARSYPAVAATNKVYAIGGTNGAVLPTVEEFDPTNGPNGNWTTKANMIAPRSHLAAAVVNNKVYAIGGHDGANPLAMVHEFDPALAPNGGWVIKTNMPTARYGLAAVAINNKIFAIGGYNSAIQNGYLATVEEFDPANGPNGTWTTRAPMPTAREGLAAVAVNNKVYAVGGYNGDSLPTVEEFDPANGPNGTWTTRASMPTARFGLAAAAVNNKVYAIGGSVGFYLTMVEEFDPANGPDGTWTTRAPMPTARSGLAAAVVNNKVYAIGGIYGDPLGTVEEYKVALSFYLHAKN